MLPIKHKYEITIPVKKEIIEYSRYVLDNYIETSFLEEFADDIPFFLEQIYITASILFEETGDFELYEQDLSEICVKIATLNKYYDLFNQGLISLIGIDEDEILYFKEVDNQENNLENENLENKINE